MPVAYTDSGHTDPDAAPFSGLTVYAAFPLDDDRADIDALVTAAQSGAAPALAFVPALFAARSVLRPVRRLRHGAERFAADVAHELRTPLAAMAAVTEVLAHGDRVRVTVTDRGPGIADDALPYVFGRFYKADAARPRSGGSGLGLAIAHENAVLHGATLTAANRPGGGAVFTLTLPSAASSPGTT
ncbi:signal transduction histidine kinase [Streptomyces ambofaciens]